MNNPKRDLVVYFNIQHCPSLYTKKHLEKFICQAKFVHTWLKPMELIKHTPLHLFVQCCGMLLTFQYP